MLYLVIHLFSYSTLLKSDQWLRESHRVAHAVRGAINFRQVPSSKIYALGQPSLEAIDEVVDRIKEAHPSAQRVVWITLREEPIVYINGAPYCLRREGFSLRNMKGWFLFCLFFGWCWGITRLWRYLRLTVGGSRRETERWCYCGVGCLWGQVWTRTHLRSPMFIFCSFAGSCYTQKHLTAPLFPFGRRSQKRMLWC